MNCLNDYAHGILLLNIFSFGANVIHIFSTFGILLFKSDKMGCVYSLKETQLTSMATENHIYNIYNVFTFVVSQITPRMF